MTQTSQACFDEKEYLVEMISIDNIPDIGDKTGEIFLDNLEKAIRSCRIMIARGFRLADFWTDPDVGVEFKLLKKRTPGESAT